jgi:hypothetical protein
MQSLRGRMIAPLIVLALLSCARPPKRPDGAVVSSAMTAPVFPLKLSGNNRYLVDQNNVPFLINQASSWGLIQSLSTADATEYMDQLKQRGFNALMVSIISNDTRFAGGPPNWQGVSPFNTQWDFSTPNDAYFAHADQIINLAAARGMLVTLVPSYLGYPNDASQGWWDEIQSANNSVTKSRAYGQYLGNRYKNFPNIIWIAGGDNTPAAGSQLEAHMKAVIDGIKQNDPNHLWTGHWDGSTGAPKGVLSTDPPAFTSYINVNGYYAFDYDLTYQRNLDAWNRSPVMMFYNLDQSYETEPGGTPQNIRRKAYDAMLMGSGGSSFNAGPNWYTFKNWKTNLDTTGSKETQLWYKFFSSRSWQTLVPDLNHTAATGGLGTFGATDYVCAARTTSGGTIIAYLPAGHTVTVDLRQVSGTQSKAWWYDPTTGAATAIGTFANTGSQPFAAPNSGSWALVVDDASLNLAAPGASGTSNPPSVATPASASPNPATAGTTNLAVLGADDGGESSLVYNWVATGSPPAPVSFSANGTNAAKNATATFTQTGSYTLQATITDAQGQTATSSVTVSVSGVQSAATAVRVNCGGGAVAPFSADQFFSGGTAFSTTAAINTTGVTNAAPAAVYQTERWGNTTYTFTGLTAGSSYTVRLHFAEIYWTSSGQRLFNVNINGSAALTNYDIFAAAGAANKAVVRDFTATATGAGQIAVQFVTVKDNAKVSGLEILGSGGSTNAPPSVGTPASASPSPVTGTTANLSVLGADDGGEPNLTYTWATTGTPPASVSFSANGTNAAKSSVATFSKAGSYTLRATITDAQGLTTTSAVTVTVNQTATSVAVSPASATVAPGGTQPFTAIASDQFGVALSSQPTFGWTVSGGGTISSGGLFTAGSSAGGPFTVTATGAGKSGTASVTVSSGSGGGFAVQVNAGGGAVAPFSSDQFASGGTAFSSSAAITTAGVTNAAPAAVYQTERWGNFSYTFGGLTAGSSYTVRLHFAEIYWTSSGQRLFDVNINGSAVLSSFDVFAAAGAANKAVVRDFTATATAASQIVVQFVGVRDNAKVSGIEILGGGSPPPPNAAPTVATAAAASPNPVNGTTTNLSVLGADDGGEPNLTYTWATTGSPPASVSFSANGTNASKSTVATFSQSGSYSLQATIRDVQGLTATSTISVSVTVPPPPPGSPLLHVDTTNPRYFADGSGKMVFLVGSHTWQTLKDRDLNDPPPAFDYNGFLNFLVARNHNFFRLWTWEQPHSWNNNTDNLKRFFQPFPWKRTGPGTANDGKPRFDFNQLDQAYFDRMRSRVIAAGSKNIYVAITLFNGWDVVNAWNPTDGGFPYQSGNNVNGISTDGLGSQTLANPEVTAIQEAYVRKVVDTVNDLDNVLYEISNESQNSSSTDNWQFHFVDFIKSYEGGKPKKHPVGMTSTIGNDANLFASHADWIAPSDRNFQGDGRKVVLIDSDHAYYWVQLKQDGQAAQQNWAWQTLTRGASPVFMDPYLEPWSGRNSPSGSSVDPYWDIMRNAVGDTRRYADRMNLKAAVPSGGLSSTGFCLAATGVQYLVYQAGSGSFTLNLTAGTYNVEWFDPNARTTTSAGAITVSSGSRTFTPPFSGHAVLFVFK